MTKNYLKKITIILIIHKGEKKKIISFLDKIPKLIEIIIVENSNDIKLKEKIKKKFKNASVYLVKNNGVGSALNFASKKVKTEYFIHIGTDIIFNFTKLKLFYNYAKKINNKFSALGPRFLNVNKESHKQSDINLEISKIKSVHGSVFFLHKKTFKELKGFDENIFLYFEETDFCKRAMKKNLPAYQLNNIKVKVTGRSVSIKNLQRKTNLQNLLSWHFIWSEFYFYKKHYGKTLSLIYFFPTLVRTIFKYLLNIILKKESEFNKYKYRLNGLLSSMLEKKSKLRLKI